MPFSQERILLIGEDQILLAARALSQWSISTVNTEDASILMKSIPFDVVLIGHTVPEEMLAALLYEARSLRSKPDLLLLRRPGQGPDFGVETHVCNLHESPDWIIKRIASLLGARAIRDRITINENIGR